MAILSDNLLTLHLFSVYRSLSAYFSLTLMLVVSVLCSWKTPKGVHPVTDFDLTQYLGCWHEVARFDHRFERGLQQVTATYSLRKDGHVRVENAGTNRAGKHKRITGKAKLVAGPHVGHLKVSFFGPFYGSYIVFHLEPDYSVALVCGDSYNYCWMLARKPQLSQQELDKYLAIAQANGFDISRFIYPEPLATAG